MDSQEIKQRLLQMDYGLLIKLAHEHGINISEDMSASEMVDRLIQDIPTACEAAAKSVTNFELAQGFEQLKEEIGKEQERGLGEVRSRLNTFTTVLGLALSILLAFAGFSSYDYFFKSRKEVNTIIESSGEIILDLTRLGVAHQKNAIDNIIRESEHLMRNISSSFNTINVDTLDKIEVNQMLIGRLKDALGNRKRFELYAQKEDFFDKEAQLAFDDVTAFYNESDKVLDTLFDINEALKTLTIVKELRKKKKQDNIAPINRAYHVWSRIELEPNYKIAAFNNFAKRVRAYRNNVLGLLEMERYANVRSRFVLDSAQDFFERAKLGYLDRKFPNPDSNLGSAYLKRYKHADDDETTEERMVYLERAEKYFEFSKGLSGGLGIQRSIAINNFAYARLYDSVLQENFYFKEDSPAWTDYFMHLSEADEKDCIESRDDIASLVWYSFSSSLRDEFVGVGEAGKSFMNIELQRRFIEELNRVIRTKEFCLDDKLGFRNNESNYELTRLFQIRKSYRDDNKRLPEHLTQRLNRLLLEWEDKDFYLRKSYSAGALGEGYKELEKAQQLLLEATNLPNPHPVVFATAVEAECQKLRYFLNDEAKRIDGERKIQELSIKAHNRGYNWRVGELTENEFCQGVIGNLDNILVPGQR